MAKPVFKIEIDTNNDGTFAADITSVVRSANWQLGMAAAFDLIARDNTAVLLVNNSTRNFSPDYTGGAYYGTLTVGRAVKISSTYALVTRTMWVGWIATIQPDSNIKGGRQCTITCSGWFERALRRESIIALQTNQTADTIISEILDASDILPPGLIGFWVLGSAVLDTSTVLGAISSYFVALAAGNTSFAFAGDWAAQTTVHGAVREIVEREAGRFWQRRDGKLVFANRQWFPSQYSITATFADKMQAMTYSYGEDISNIVSTTYAPRLVGSSGTTIATLASATLVDASDYTDIEYRFTLANTQGTIGATTLITPVTTTDYTANSLADGTGTNLTANITAQIIDTQATLAMVRYSNSGAAAYILATSKLRGTPLTKFNQLLYEASDTTSILNHGKLAYSTQGVQDSFADASTLAEYQLSLRKSAVGRVSNVTWNGWDTALTADLLTITVGDKITLSEQQTQISGNWFVLGESHSYSSENYSVTHVLEDGGTIVYWLLGIATQSELDTNAYLAPL